MKSLRLTSFLLLGGLVACVASPAQGPTLVYYLLKGQRIKVDAKTARGNQLYADSIEVINVEDNDFAIKGRVRKLYVAAKTFEIHDFVFTPQEGL